MVNKNRKIALYVSVSYNPCLLGIIFNNTKLELSPVEFIACFYGFNDIVFQQDG